MGLRLIPKHFLLTLGLFFPIQSSVATDDALYVKVRSTKLRAQPQQWAKPLADLRYGDVLKPGKLDDGWHSVTAKNAKGFVHDSALTERRVVLQANASTVGAGSERDVILAGKGFNKQVEQGYAAQNQSLNYAEVDKMEKLVVSDGELSSFVSGGQLGGGR
jgi:hypothetical protein